MSPKRIRLDDLLVARGFFDSRDEASRACFAGEITSNDVHVTAPSQMVLPSIELRVKKVSKFVSRGGDKLQGALKSFSYSPEGKNCIDAGCSTGGFTDCLLQAGAAHVSSVDVGYGDFSMRLRNDARVSLFERTNIRMVQGEELEGPFDLLVADLSFIGLENLLPVFAGILKESGDIIVLVKPQFEIAKERVGDNGVVRKRQDHIDVLEGLLAKLPENGFGALGLCGSPIKGPAGNIEFFIFARLGADSVSIDVANVVEDVHRRLGEE